MLNTTCSIRATARRSTPRICRNIVSKARNHARTATHAYADTKKQHFVRSVAVVITLASIATAWQWTRDKSIFREVHAEEPALEPEPEFEKARRRPRDEEDNRTIISSQHLQVKKSWEKPGVYSWGSNSGRVAAPDSQESFIKTPSRIRFFDGMLLRDIKLDRNFAAAVDEKGDLIQWGIGFSKETTQPTYTLRGKNLISVALSRDRLITLSARGDVYSIPVSQAEQKAGPKPVSASWIPFWGSSENGISYRVRTPQSLGWNERVTHISSGLEHALLLTSSGRVFSLASGTEDYPTKGQLGIPGLTWESRPTGAFDMPHEISTLKGFPVAKIATGDYHSLVSDAAGRAFAFGDNSAGQLGFENVEAVHIDAPSLLPTQRLYSGTGRQASVTNVFAGGNTSFMTIEAVKPSRSPRDSDRITADLWAFGFGLTGQLGTGRWVHNQTSPTKVPAFSGLFEYDEHTSSVVPIKLAYLSVGANHAAGVLDNVASVSVLGKSRKTTENDTNWGRDILFWGNNEFYQIGSGKRNNVSAPTYLQPLDQAAEAERAAGALGWGKQKMEKEMHRFQITPKAKVKIGERWVNMEQKVECGRGVTAVYSAV